MMTLVFNKRVYGLLYIININIIQHGLLIYFWIKYHKHILFDIFNVME